ncbi:MULTISPECIES: hypothetical protein [Acinetobacter]|uniref:hypothetical protein n=1 Tax=Acinetobacter TaxID=469 RepID=UPI0002D03D80|nr:MULTISPECIES: hypothetical protein [Acinetobacter]ENW30363.1 hypothetical protein F924_00392 [Acinetobacter lwoffii ATCC 9957 = CIP 70.31]UVB01986.1 hypothetical protein ABWED_2742 [Acinetobacter lwoffii]HAA07088.1 hypothetical protein [Acinetobacter schindleri]
MSQDDSSEQYKELIEKLAAIEHERWAHWQSYLHSKCLKNENGSLTIPAELVERWNKQINTGYEELTEDEKESDREQVQKYFYLLIPFLSDQNK